MLYKRNNPKDNKKKPRLPRNILTISTFGCSSLVTEYIKVYNNDENKQLYIHKMVD
jgi:hypothetical protein